MKVAPSSSAWPSVLSPEARARWNETLTQSFTFHQTSSHPISSRRPSPPPLLSLTFLPSLVRESFQRHPFHSLSLTPPSLAPRPRPAHLNRSKPVITARGIPADQSAFRLHSKCICPDARLEASTQSLLLLAKEVAQRTKKSLKVKDRSLVSGRYDHWISVRRVLFQQNLGSHTLRQPTKICSRVSNFTQHPQGLLERRNSPGIPEVFDWLLRSSSQRHPALVTT